MCKAREAIATTNLVWVRDSENGLLGREIFVGASSCLDRWWMCIVVSQEAEMRMFWGRL